MDFDFDLGDYGGADGWETALAFGTGSTIEQPATPDTVTADAVRGMGPTVPVSSVGNEWGVWARDLAKLGLGYAIQKDALQAGLKVNTQTPIVMQPQAQPIISGQLLLLLAVGGVVYLIAKG